MDEMEYKINVKSIIISHSDPTRVKLNVNGEVVELTLGDMYTLLDGSELFTLSSPPSEKGSLLEFGFIGKNKGSELCGDGICEINEDSQSCSEDCTPVIEPSCGDWICDEGETTDNCPVDCPTYIQPEIPEWCKNLLTQEEIEGAVDAKLIASQDYSNIEAGYLKDATGETCLLYFFLDLPVDLPFGAVAAYHENSDQPDQTPYLSENTVVVTENERTYLFEKDPTRPEQYIYGSLIVALDTSNMLIINLPSYQGTQETLRAKLDALDLLTRSRVPDTFIRVPDTLMRGGS